MTLIYPNIVPENNLRLPDALTIKHGPARLLATFVLAGDRAARQIGIRLQLRHDFHELVYLNKERTSRGDWFRLVDMFNPQHCDLTVENSYWISGENERGEIVLTQAGRIFYWPDTTLKEEARLMFYGGHDIGQQCVVTASAANLITGVVFCAGSHWIHPNFRGIRFSQLLGRLGRAYAVSRWPVDWAIALITPPLVENRVAAGYGYKHQSRSIFYPGSPLGDLELILNYLSALEAYEDLANFLTTKLSVSDTVAAASAELERPLDQSVTRTSSDEVFHGSSNLS
jgi:hypothetical protein